VERETTQHGPRLDDELVRKTQSLTHGAPIEARVDENRLQEDAGEGEPVPEALVAEGPAEHYGSSGLSHRAVRERSELARHLRPSIFPATRGAVLECAREEHADDALVAELQDLPDRAYKNPTEVWEALGGETEPSRQQSEPHDPAVRERRPMPMGAPRPASVREPRPDGAPRPTSAPRLRRFPFHFDWRYRVAALAFGITPDRAVVEVEEMDGERWLTARFGFWTLRTPVSNVVDASATGPYNFLKTIGPAHVSLRDGGLTFATSDRCGLCITFAEPVPAVDPLGLVRHPALTVTVADVAALAGTLVGHE
jgi:uncharacterized protein DUF2795